MVRTSRCGRDNPGSTPGEDMYCVSAPRSFFGGSMAWSAVALHCWPAEPLPASGHVKVGLENSGFQDLVASFRDLGPMLFLLLVMCSWSRGVMVSTLDSESSDRSSNPHRTSMPIQLLCAQVTCLSACAQEVNAIPACTFARCTSAGLTCLSPTAISLRMHRISFNLRKSSGEEPA